jgi:predicted metal-dependent peptidase
MSSRNKSPHQVDTSNGTNGKSRHGGPVDPEVAAALVKRCKAQSMSLGWKFPFFLPSIARIEFRADNRRPTACVDLKGIIRVNPEFAKSLKDTELQFVIAHELMHLLMLHHDRRGHREPLRWNIATDLIINRTLKNVSDSAGAGAFTMPKEGIIADENQAELTAEQLYSEIPEPPQWLKDAFTQGAVPVGQGCGPEKGDSDGDGGDQDQDKDGDGGDMTEDQLRRQWRECAAQSQLAGRQAGTHEGNLLADLLDIPPPKVRWSEVLRGALYRAIAEAGRDDVSWHRRSRRSTTDIILPGGITYRCKAAVVIDTSGSMSDEDLSRCVAETTAIVNNCRVPVFLVAHDHAVQEACWIRPGAKGTVHSNIKKRMKGRGGTSFDEAYQRVEDEPGKFNVMVHLTDGEIYGDWPDRPSSVRRHVIALVGSANKTDCPADARIIEVEI